MQGEEPGNEAMKWVGFHVQHCIAIGLSQETHIGDVMGDCRESCMLGIIISLWAHVHLRGSEPGYKPMRQYSCIASYYTIALDE